MLNSLAQWTFATRFASDCRCDGLVHSAPNVRRCSIQFWLRELNPYCGACFPLVKKSLPDCSESCFCQRRKSTPQNPPPPPQKKSGEVFLLTVRAFFLTVELLCLQCCLDTLSHCKQRSLTVSKKSSNCQQKSSNCKQKKLKTQL